MSGTVAGLIVGSLVGGSATGLIVMACTRSAPGLAGPGWRGWAERWATKTPATVAPVPDPTPVPAPPPVVAPTATEPAPPPVPRSPMTGQPLPRWLTSESGFFEAVDQGGAAAVMAEAAEFIGSSRQWPGQRTAGRHHRTAA